MEVSGHSITSMHFAMLVVTYFSHSHHDATELLHRQHHHHLELVVHDLQFLDFEAIL